MVAVTIHSALMFVNPPVDRLPGIIMVGVNVMDRAWIVVLGINTTSFVREAAIFAFSCMWLKRSVGRYKNDLEDISDGSGS